MQLILWIVVGLIAGWVTGKSVRGSRFGSFSLRDIGIGIAGAILGGELMRLVGGGHKGMLSTILPAIGGAVVLTLLYRRLRRPPARGVRIETGQSSDKHDTDFRRAA